MIHNDIAYQVEVMNVGELCPGILCCKSRPINAKIKLDKKVKFVSSTATTWSFTSITTHQTFTKCRMKRIRELVTCTNVDVRYSVSSSVWVLLVITVVILTQLSNVLFAGLRFVWSNSVCCRRAEQQPTKMPCESHSDTGTDKSLY